MNKTALRSKQAIVTALFNKLASYPFNELTISEIAAEANVSRKTFYQHFPSKFAIIQY
ncbi:TetR/AcrR family transcriptional regulator, partial [Enterococcus faecium]